MKEHRFHKFTGLMALLTFAVFAVCVLSVLLSGAGVYRRLVTDGARQYDSRTAAQYLTTRVRQADALLVEDFAGTEALVFPETVNGRSYLTRIYCYDGNLRELFTTEEGAFLPEDGEILFPAQALSLTLENQYLQAVITLPEGDQQTLLLYLHGRKGDLP